MHRLPFDGHEFVEVSEPVYQVEVDELDAARNVHGFEDPAQDEL